MQQCNYVLSSLNSHTKTSQPEKNPAFNSNFGISALMGNNDHVHRQSRYSMISSEECISDNITKVSTIRPRKRKVIEVSSSSCSVTETDTYSDIMSDCNSPASISALVSSSVEDSEVIPPLRAAKVPLEPIDFFKTISLEWSSKFKCVFCTRCKIFVLNTRKDGFDARTINYHHNRCNTNLFPGIGKSAVETNFELLKQLPLWKPFAQELFFHGMTPIPSIPVKILKFMCGCCEYYSDSTAALKLHWGRNGESGIYEIGEFPVQPPFSRDSKRLRYRVYSDSLAATLNSVPLRKQYPLPLNMASNEKEHVFSEPELSSQTGDYERDTIFESSDSNMSDKSVLGKNRKLREINTRTIVCSDSSSGSSSSRFSQIRVQPKMHIRPQRRGAAKISPMVDTTDSEVILARRIRKKTRISDFEYYSNSDTADKSKSDNNSEVISTRSSSSNFESDSVSLSEDEQVFPSVSKIDSPAHFPTSSSQLGSAIRFPAKVSKADMGSSAILGSKPPSKALSSNIVNSNVAGSDFSEENATLFTFATSLASENPAPSGEQTPVSKISTRSASKVAAAYCKPIKTRSKKRIASSNKLENSEYGENFFETNSLLWNSSLNCFFCTKCNLFVLNNLHNAYDYTILSKHCRKNHKTYSTIAFFRSNLDIFRSSLNWKPFDPSIFFHGMAAIKELEVSVFKYKCSSCDFYGKGYGTIRNHQKNHHEFDSCGVEIGSYTVQKLFGKKSSISSEQSRISWSSAGSK